MIRMRENEKTRGFERMRVLGSEEKKEGIEVCREKRERSYEEYEDGREMKRMKKKKRND